MGTMLADLQVMGTIPALRDSRQISQMGVASLTLHFLSSFAGKLSGPADEFSESSSMASKSFEHFS